jgi:hypothetical protein
MGAFFYKKCEFFPLFLGSKHALPFQDMYFKVSSSRRYCRELGLVENRNVTITEGKYSLICNWFTNSISPRSCDSIAVVILCLAPKLRLVTSVKISDPRAGVKRYWALLPDITGYGINMAVESAEGARKRLQTQTQPQQQPYQKCTADSTTFSQRDPTFLT